MAHSRWTRLMNCRLPGPAGCGAQWTKWWSEGSGSHAMSSKLSSRGSVASAGTAPPESAAPGDATGTPGSGGTSPSCSGAPGAPAGCAASGCVPSLAPLLPVLASSSVAWPPKVAPSSVESSPAASSRFSFSSSAVSTLGVADSSSSPSMGEAAWWQPSPSSAAGSVAVSSAACDSAMLPSSSSPTLYSSRGQCKDTTPSSQRTRTEPASRAATCPTRGPLSPSPRRAPSAMAASLGASSSQSRQRITASPRR
mmetsp:Transcript_88102/g.275902  ORF Transcript_88102/g.275902 Transcript_88102/m.275902 type:complete len:253 (-) Transcript_88102:37-795(-)